VLKELAGSGNLPFYSAAPPKSRRVAAATALPTTGRLSNGLKPFSMKQSDHLNGETSFTRRLATSRELVAREDLKRRRQLVCIPTLDSTCRRADLAKLCRGFGANYLAAAEAAPAVIIITFMSVRRQLPSTDRLSGLHLSLRARRESALANS
jgi:hypothetical protein